MYNSTILKNFTTEYERGVADSVLVCYTRNSGSIPGRIENFRTLVPPLGRQITE